MGKIRLIPKHPWVRQDLIQNIHGQDKTYLKHSWVRKDLIENINGFGLIFCFTALRHILGHFGRSQLT